MRLLALPRLFNRLSVYPSAWKNSIIAERIWLILTLPILVQIWQQYSRSACAKGTGWKSPGSCITMWGILCDDVITHLHTTIKASRNYRCGKLSSAYKCIWYVLQYVNVFPYTAILFHLCLITVYIRWKTKDRAHWQIYWNNRSFPNSLCQFQKKNSLDL
jgi:hypothetical protein